MSQKVWTQPKVNAHLSNGFFNVIFASATLRLLHGKNVTETESETRTLSSRLFGCLAAPQVCANCQFHVTVSEIVMRQGTSTI